jgi:hypothetical protein
MTRMQFQKNKFSGTIPHTLGRLDKMEQFMLEGNQLQGTIPPEMCDLTKNYLKQFIVDCYDQRTQQGFDCEPNCCTLCRDFT